MSETVAFATIDRARDALQRQEFATAHELWADVRALLPGHVIGYLGEALTLRQAGQIDAADVKLAELGRGFPDEAGPAIEYAVTALQRRDWATALGRYESARARFPDLAIIYCGQIQALRELGQMATAVKLAAEAEARFPDDPHVLIEGAVLARSTNDWPAAIARWDAVRRALPDEPIGYVHGAAALRSALRPAEAEALLETALRHFPDDPEIAVEYAWVAHVQNRYDDTAARFQAVRNRFPDNPAGWLHGSGALRAQSALDQAEALLRDAIDRFPDEPRFMLDHATIKLAPSMRRHQDWPEALHRIERMLAAHPGYEPGIIEAVKLLRDGGFKARAEEVVRSAVTRLPDSPTIALLHAEAASLRGDNAEALTRYRSTKQLFPHVTACDIGLARGLAQGGRFDEAEALLVAAMAAYPMVPDVADAFADLAARQEHWGEAARRWTDAHERFPDQAEFAHRAFEARLHAPDSAPAVPGEPAREGPDLALRFESLGGVGVGCEFGIFQRHCGVEPLGLLRWSEIDLAMLMFVLTTRGEGIGAEENTELWLDMQQSGRREYNTLDRRGMMRMHTFVYEDQSSHDRMYTSVLKRLRFLRGKLIDDLNAAEKIFVYHFDAQTVTRTQIAELGAAVRAYGSNYLLCVQLADADHPAGYVEEIGDGLLLGYIDRFMRSPKGPHAAAPSPCWVTIVRNADALVRAARDRAAMAGIMMQFESLGGTGHGCEFGLVQRALGAEPMGLLRWADLAFDNLVAGLATEFAGVGDTANTIVFVPDGSTLYWSRDTRFWMAQGSSIKAADTTIDVATAQICARLRFLRKKLADDLREGRKIFVYQNMQRSLTDAELTSLHHAVRRYGDATLLYVRTQDADHRNGSVRWAAPGLLVGHIDHFTHSPDDIYLGSSTESWGMVCRAAHALWTDTTPPSAPQ